VQDILWGNFRKHLSLWANQTVKLMRYERKSSNTGPPGSSASTASTLSTTNQNQEQAKKELEEKIRKAE